MMTVKRAFLSAVLVGLLSTNPLAQNNARPPQGQSQGSSLPEILAGLDKNALAQARIGLKDKGSPWGQDSSGAATISEDMTPGTTMIFAQGFKLAKVDACTLTLRNEDTQMIAHSKLIAASQEHFALKVYLPLQELSDRKGKAPYRHTKDLDKANYSESGVQNLLTKDSFHKARLLLSFLLPAPEKSRVPGRFRQ